MSKRKKERVALMVTKGGFVPADDFSRQRLRKKDYRIGDVVSADLKKSRNPRFNGLVHVFGQMVADNVPEFTGMDAHGVLKRLQWEANIACEEFSVMQPNGMQGVVRWPRSLSYEDMDDVEFGQVFKGFCNHVAERYWPELDGDQVAAMAEVMGDVA